eukprot:XP_001705631.1 Hypothetical protein GL50803_29206 [Giardia lamblia ATCC 50803]
MSTRSPHVPPHEVHHRSCCRDALAMRPPGPQHVPVDPHVDPWLAQRKMPDPSLPPARPTILLIDRSALLWRQVVIQSQAHHCAVCWAGVVCTHPCRRAHMES